MRSAQQNAARTAREYAAVDAVTTDSAGAATVRRTSWLMEPLTSYNVARVQRDVLGGSSNVGGSPSIPTSIPNRSAATSSWRWEYIRGSTLFFVWNISTLDLAGPGVFTPLHDLGTGFGADGTHVFMVKMTYWLVLEDQSANWNACRGRAKKGSEPRRAEYYQPGGILSFQVVGPSGAIPVSLPSAGAT